MGEGVRRLSSINKQFVVAVSVLVAVAAATAAALGYIGGGRSTDGPLNPGPPHGWAATAKVGDVFTDGLELLHLRGTEQAVIEDVRLVGDDGLELAGAVLAGPERGIGAVQYMPTFPPHNNPQIDAELVEAEGTWITPEGKDRKGTWELLLGIRPTTEGYLVRTGVEVDYSVQGEEYTVLIPAHLAVCTSQKYERRGECPLPPGE